MKSAMTIRLSSVDRVRPGFATFKETNDTFGHFASFFFAFVVNLHREITPTLGIKLTGDLIELEWGLNRGNLFQWRFVQPLLQIASFNAILEL